MRLHFCPLDRECRAMGRLSFTDDEGNEHRLGVPWRIHLHTRKGHLAVALLPGSRMIRIKNWSDHPAPEDYQYQSRWFIWKATEEEP